MSSTTAASTRYHVTALALTIWFNHDGDHDHNGLMFALTQNVPLLRYIEALGKADLPGGIYPELEPAVASQAALIGITLPATPAQARQPQPIIRPLVLRARKGERLIVTLTNEIRPKPGKNRDVGIHLIGGGYDVRSDDGSDVGQNPSSLVPYGSSRVYEWHCEHEGVFAFHDGGNYSGDEGGTNVHGLFGALIVEPPCTKWRDPVTGRVSHGPGGFTQLDGLYLDVMPESFDHAEPLDPGPEPEGHTWPEPVPYFNFAAVAHREFVIVFHDEPEFVPPHGELEPNPCDTDGHGGHSATGRHGGSHNAGMPIMPVSYRAEPMINRERRLWKQMKTGPALSRPVLNEEQHHSSWMFGDPATPILKAYIGDPVRIRFVHAGVKETHVFHLHLYEWHAAAGNPASPRIDAISVSPQTAHTIEPVWGAGNRHQVAGDIIWHCHLYPHFHEGMWGMFRTFETRQHGTAGAFLDTVDPLYAGRKIGLYPDGTPIEKLLPLPNRSLPPKATPKHPGFPLYIPGVVQQKSPIPPWPDREVQVDEVLPPYVTSLLTADMPPDFDYRPKPTDLERAAFNPRPVPGELFTRNPISMQQKAIYSYDPATDTSSAAKKSERTKERDAFLRNSAPEVAHDIAVVMRDITYNSHGWHDKHGHLYYLEADGDPAARAGPMEPLFFRAQHGQVVNVILRNATPMTIPETEFDHAFPPCPARPWEGECATHVHMVKFDPICADGAATGWNYMSGARHGKRLVYRWWADQEFGTIFFHDHMFANHRQKHGLFGALLVEPAGSKFFHNVNPGQGIISGVQARIERHEQDPVRLQGPHGQGWFREFCISIGDFIPMWAPSDHGVGDQALNPPDVVGGHGDQGVMGLNYRSAPIRERPGDPADWFRSSMHGDPDTTVFKTYEGDPVWLRIVQGSHEEQHSFQVHGLRWRRYRDQLDSAVRNQQSLGISEAYTFINQVPIGPGDHLYKLSGADDLWLGCWGLIRALPRPIAGEPLELSRPEGEPWPAPAESPAQAMERRFRVKAERQRLLYRSDIVDPYGLVYRLTGTKEPGGEWTPTGPSKGNVREPLILWCREGERVVVELTNSIDLLPGESLEPEPNAPEVPVEKADRPVSSHVSMHADLVRYQIRAADGANVGHNPVQTAQPGETKLYEWDTSRPTSEHSNEGEPLGPLLLQDMADFRNHRHHGLVGALVVLQKDATPFEVQPRRASARSTAKAVWHGSRVTVVRKGEAPSNPATEREEHMVLLMQDGLRLFMKGNGGNVGFSLPDPPNEEAGDAEKEDQGQKGFNYRTEPLGPVFDPQGNPYTRLRPNPATPVWHVPSGAEVRLHLVGACDKPRHHSFTIHGVTWREDRFEPPLGPVPWVSSESAVSCGTARTLAFKIPAHPGHKARDLAYRSGVLKWDVPQGLWGIMRVKGQARDEVSAGAVTISLLGAAAASAVAAVSMFGQRRRRKRK